VCLFFRVKSVDMVRPSLPLHLSGFPIHSPLFTGSKVYQGIPRDFIIVESGKKEGKVSRCLIQKEMASEK
jgi:hypothetical protein